MDPKEAEMALTDTEPRKARPTAKPYKLADSGGLFLAVMPAGGKLWRWKYHFEGREKLMALGSYPEVSLAEVRSRHAEGRRLLAAGVDPMARRMAAKTASREQSGTTFEAIAAQWMEHWKEDKSLRHVDSTRRRLDANILPTLGALQIGDIQAPDVVAMVRAVEARGARDVAKRALETTGQIFRYAVAHGHTTRNPAAEIKPRDVLKATVKENYARVDAKDLPALLKQIEVYPGTHVTRLALKLMALTFVRTGELIGAHWSEIDFEEKRWNIPAERMKMRTPHIVPLSEQSIDVLRTLHTLTGSGALLFPGDRNAKKPMSNNTILKGLERMGYKGRMTGHGFRGVASTILHEQGFDHQHIELQLAHAPRNVVSAAYNHALYLKPRAAMMQKWADYLENMQRGGKVLAFRSSAASR
jgi:integrase